MLSKYKSGEVHLEKLWEKHLTIDNPFKFVLRTIEKNQLFSG